MIKLGSKDCCIALVAFFPIHNPIFLVQKMVTKKLSLIQLFGEKKLGINSAISIFKERKTEIDLYCLNLCVNESSFPQVTI
jgi:hypothetical protein